MPKQPKETLDVRTRILRAGTELLARGGRDAVSTRAVSAAAGVQPPTIYRQFGDMRGLLDAVARETLAGYVRRKATPASTDDPVADLRRGWDLHVAFGLANPAAYALIYGDPAATADAPAARDGEEILRALLVRVAEAGRLRIGVPDAVRLMTAAGTGVTLTLLAMPPEGRDPRLAHAMREAMLAAVTVAPAADAPRDSARRKTPDPARVASRAVALRAVLAEATGAATHALTAGERHVLGEWLDRLADADA